ncbi:MAG: VOC family protein [Kofleriaceae bacterium]|nr:VOC family protein [Myxococcales bacterium]MCB9562030.1 VOC family protein [Kofleriaceae bacterium]
MPTPLLHWELMVDDVERTRDFYRKVLGWTFSAEGPEYTMIDAGAPPGGGLMARPPGAPAALNVYFGVADLDRTLHDAVEAGARVIVPRTEIPPGWFAMFLDLDGIPVGVMQLRAAPPG